MTYPPGATFCRTCGYCLYGLAENRCPECGHGFDPADPRTFRARPPRGWPRRVLFWGGVPLLLAALVYGGFLGWLYWGWKAEAPARALATGRSDVLKTRSVLPSALAWLLIGDCRAWQERVDTLHVYSPSLSAAQVRSIAACRRLRVLNLYVVPLKGQDVAALGECRELEELYLWSAGLHSEDLAPLSRLVHLKMLTLRGNDALDDTALAAIAPLRELKSLDLTSTAITDDELAHLAGMTNLEALSVWNCPRLTDAAVPHLLRLKGLKELQLYGTRLTPEAFRQLHSALPGCKVYGP